MVDGVSYELKQGLTLSKADGFAYINFTPSTYTAYVGLTKIDTLINYYNVSFVSNGQFIRTTGTGQRVAYPNVEPGSTYTISMNCNGTYGVDAQIAIANFDSTTNQYVTTYVTNPDPRVTIDYNTMVITFTDVFTNNTYINLDRIFTNYGTMWSPTIYIPYPAP